MCFEKNIDDFGYVNEIFWFVYMLKGMFVIMGFDDLV